VTGHCVVSPGFAAIRGGGVGGVLSSEDEGEDVVAVQVVVRCILEFDSVLDKKLWVKLRAWR
jgi:hypothetical protein